MHLVLPKELPFLSRKFLLSLRSLLEPRRWHGKPRLTASSAGNAPGRRLTVRIYRLIPASATVGPAARHRGSGAVFITQAPTLPHRGTLGGGRRAFFLYEQVRVNSTASSL
jgi:hypothetical protein